MKIHMIGNAHIDPVWLWTYQEGRQEVLATFRSALDRLAEDDAALFVASSALHYQWVEETDPTMFEEIRERVSQRRWEIVGGWWLQPDCNLPSGESFVRQALYGHRYFASRFGVRTRVGYNVDAFGHAGTLPQLLRRSGYRAYVFMRPKPEELDLPARLFRWRSADGSEVVAYRLPFTYCTWAGELDEHVRAVADELERTGEATAMCFFGVGNHGGGPTRANLASVHRLAGDDTLPALGFSTPERYFEQVGPHADDLPVWSDELQHHASGCYAAHAGVKRWNRTAEERLGAAERWSSVAAAIGVAPYPSAAFEAAWKAVLFNQFHDILAGSSIERAYDDARDTYGEALASAGRALDRATQGIAWSVRQAVPEGARPYVVCNAHAHPIEAFVEIEGAASAQALRATDERGEPLATQRLASEAVAEGRVRYGFMLELPPLGYRSVALVPTDEPETEERTMLVQVTAGRGVIENELVRVEIDAAKGGIARLRDERGVELIAEQGCGADVVADEGDTWAHGITRFDVVVGRFAVERVEVVEHGPVRSALRVVSRFEGSTLTQTVSLRRGSPVVDVATDLDWQQRHQLCKLRVPLALEGARAVYEQPYGEIDRPTDGEEEPGHRWLDVSGVASCGQAAGVSLLNDGKYAFDVSGGTIGMTVARSPIIAHHEPSEPPEGSEPRYLDQGLQRFRYQLLPHAGDRVAAGTARLAAALNHGPIVLPGRIGGGDMPAQAAYLWVDAEGVDVTALKRAEADDGYVVRLVERAGRAVVTRLHAAFLGREVDVAIGCHEIATVHLPDDATLEARRVDLLELDEAAA